MNVKYDPYNYCYIPSTSLAMSYTFLDLDEMVRYMIVSTSKEWLRPSRWPISCTTTDSKLIAVHHKRRESMIQFLAPSRWNQTSGREKVFALMSELVM